MGVAAPIFSAIPAPNVASSRSFFTKPITNPRNAVPKNFRITAVDDEISVVISNPDQAELTWQIVVGALAGVTPFVVAGIEFSKRIVAQKKCNVCNGLGLVSRDNEYYFRCPACGGFLPWQSWRRFFTG